MEVEVEGNNKGLEVIPFEKLAITIITLVVPLTSRVNIIYAALMLPLTKINMSDINFSQLQNYKIPHCKTPGAILSIRPGFKNSVTIDISTIKKNISLKISTNCIQMCGASSRDDGVEATEHILGHLRKIQYYLNKIKTINFMEIIEWLSENTKGDDIIRTLINTKKFSNVTLSISKCLNDNKLIQPKNIPANFDDEIMGFILPFMDEFIYQSDYINKLKNIAKVDIVIEEPLTYKYIKEVMVNYNYSLGFEINRTKLNDFINGKLGFVSRYNNALANSVTIELPYEIPNSHIIKKRKNKVPHHTFLVYRSGSVTQSGPGGEIMREAYYLFMQNITDYLEHLTSEGEPIIYKSTSQFSKNKYIKKYTYK